MNKKVSIGVCISLVIIAVSATFAITMVFSKQIYNGIISNISQRSQSFDSADEIISLIGLRDLDLDLVMVNIVSLFSLFFFPER